MFDIFKPKWKNEDPTTRLEALDSIDDVNILQEIVLYDKNQVIRTKALKKINEDKILYNILLETTN